MYRQLPSASLCIIVDEIKLGHINPIELGPSLVHDEYKSLQSITLVLVLVLTKFIRSKDQGKKNLTSLILAK